MSAATQRSSCVLLPLACAALLLAAAALTGCDSGGSTGTAPSMDQPAIATPVQHPLLQNIPLPAGFRLIQERSVASLSGTTRVAKCEFQGGLSTDEVARFYENLMPSARFTLGPKSFDNGEYTMRFDSDSEECNLRIKRSGSKTVLIIDVRPLSKGSTERDTQPPVRR
jgi:hypothetical protein